MKRALFIFALIILASPALAQTQIQGFAADPVTCDPSRGLLYYNTVTQTFKSCVAVNTWSAFGGSTTPGGSSGQIQFNNASAFGGITGSSVTAGTGAISLTAGADTTTALTINSHSATQSATSLDVSNQSTGGAGTGTLAGGAALFEGRGLGSFNPGGSSTVVAIQQESSSLANDALIITNKQALSSSSRTSTLQLFVPDNGVATISGGNAVGDGSGNYDFIYFDQNPSIYGAPSAPGALGIALVENPTIASQVAVTLGNVNALNTGNLYNVVNSTGLRSGADSNGCNFWVASNPLASSPTIAKFCGPGTAVIDPLTYSGFGLGHMVADATIANGSPNVSCPNSDCNFLTTATIGNEIYVGPGLGGNGAATLNTTILSVTDNNHLVANANATANATGTASLIWGPVVANSAGTGPLQLAAADFVTALKTGPAFFKIPCGLMIIEGGIPTAITSKFAPSVGGCGPAASVFAPDPNFNWTSTSISTHMVLFGGLQTGGSYVAQTYLHDFAIFGNGLNVCPSSSGFFMLGIQAQSAITSNLYANSWCVNNGNVQGFTLSPTSLNQNIQSDFAGQPCGSMTVGGQPNVLIQIFCGDSGQGLQLAGTGPVVSSGGSYGSSSCGQGLGIGASVIVQSTGDNISSGANVANNGTLNVSQDTISATNCSTQGPVLLGGSGATVNFSNHTKVTPSGTTQQAVTGSAGTVSDDGTNTIAAGTNGYFTSGLTEVGTGNNIFYAVGTGVGTASQTLFLNGPSGATNAFTNTTATTISAVAPKAGTLADLSCTATAGGVNASSGVVTVRTAPLSTGTFASSSITGTFGTTTAASDHTHSAAVTINQPIQIQITTQAAETLAGVQCQLLLH